MVSQALNPTFSMNAFHTPCNGTLDQSRDGQSRLPVSPLLGADHACADHDDRISCPNVSPEAWRHSDGGDVAMPAFPHALDLAQDVAHDLTPGALRCDAVLGPLGQVLQVEGQIVLRGSRPK